MLRHPGRLADPKPREGHLSLPGYPRYASPITDLVQAITTLGRESPPGVGNFLRVMPS